MIAPGRAVLVLLGLIAACRAPRYPAPAPFIALSTTAVETREVQLDGDLVTVRLQIPPTAEVRRPTVISASGNRGLLLQQGFLVVTYRINREVLKPSAPPRASAEGGAGKWVLASPAAAMLGRDYLRSIAAAAAEIPKVIDYLVSVPSR